MAAARGAARRAGGLYRAALENSLGFNKRGESLSIEPCIPADWKEFEITYRHKTATYHITVENPLGVCSGSVKIEVDGKVVTSNRIELIDDQMTQTVRVIIGVVKVQKNPEVVRWAR